MGLLTIIRKTRLKEKQIRVLMLYVVFTALYMITIILRKTLTVSQRTRQCRQDDDCQTNTRRRYIDRQSDSWIRDSNYSVGRLQPQCLYARLLPFWILIIPLMIPSRLNRGYRRTNELTTILEELLRSNRCGNLGSRFKRPGENWRLQEGITRIAP